MKKVLKTIASIFLIGIMLFISCKKELPCENCGANPTGNSNKTPIAKAGPDQTITLPTDSVSLDGSSSSDPDGTISGYLWTKISGPAFFTIINPSATRSVVKNLMAGVYKFELKVTDNEGLTVKDTVQVTVNDPALPNRPPVANAGADQSVMLPANIAYLDGRGSTDPDNNITAYNWTKIFGPSSFNITNRTAIETPVTDLVQGEYWFELKVTDAGGLFSKDTMRVIVDMPTLSYCPPDNRSVISAQLVPFGTLSEARRWMTVAAAGNKMFFAGGQGLGAYASQTVDIYDFTTGGWSSTQLSLPRFGLSAIAAGNKIYFAGGHTVDAFTTTSRIDIYDLVSNSWSIAELSEPRMDIAVATVGNKILFAGGDSYGSSGNTVTDKVDIYDTYTNTWSTATLSVARSYISATVVANKVFFAGGSSPCFDASDRIDIYDYTTNTWSVSNLDEPKTFHGGLAVGNNIFWAGGYTVLNCLDNSIQSCKVEKRNAVNGTTSTSYLSEPCAVVPLQKNSSLIFLHYNKPLFDIYNIVSDTWSIGRMNELIYDPSVISVNNTIYVAGGGYPNPLSNRIYKLEF